jgi:hypothetical protein
VAAQWIDAGASALAHVGCDGISLRGGRVKLSMVADNHERLHNSLQGVLIAFQTFMRLAIFTWEMLNRHETEACFNMNQRYAL